MPAPPGRIDVLTEPDAAYVRIAGRATAPLTPGFAALVERLLAAGVRRVFLDLSECLTMDSTFSGALAQAALRPKPEPPPGTRRFVLVDPTPAVIELLDNLFVLDLFERTDKASLKPAAGVAVDATPDAAGKAELNRCCLDAHQLLSVLHPDNAARFKDVIRYLEENLAAAGGASPVPPPKENP